MSDAEIITFGCRLNAYESEVMRRHAARAGSVDADHRQYLRGDRRSGTPGPPGDPPGAPRQARRPHHRHRLRRPDLTRAFAAMPEVDRVIGNRDKLKAEAFALAEWHDRARSRQRHHVGARDRRPSDRRLRRPRPRLRPGAEGCDHRCTFCIIPFGRGNRALRRWGIARQVASWSPNGYHEVVLTGVDLTAYGADLPGQPALGSWSARLLATCPTLPRLRLVSIDRRADRRRLMRVIARAAPDAASSSSACRPATT